MGTEEVEQGAVALAEAAAGAVEGDPDHDRPRQPEGDLVLGPDLPVELRV
jgi:hypothetical protein